MNLKVSVSNDLLIGESIFEYFSNLAITVFALNVQTRVVFVRKVNRLMSECECTWHIPPFSVAGEQMGSTETWKTLARQREVPILRET